MDLEYISAENLYTKDVVPKCKEDPQTIAQNTKLVLKSSPKTPKFKPGTSIEERSLLTDFQSTDKKTQIFSGSSDAN